MTNQTDKDLAFLRNDQYNFIKFQIKNVLHAYATTKDKNVLNALKSHSLNEIMSKVPEINLGQKERISKILDIEEEKQAERFLTELKKAVIPFKHVTEKTITKLFPKAKKLKAPSLETIDFKNLSYLGWYDIRSEKKFLIIDDNRKLIGVEGTFNKGKKGICSLCNGHEEIGLFMTTVKSGKETYTNRGNYICTDSQRCNENIMTLDKLTQFVANLKK